MMDVRAYEGESGGALSQPVPSLQPVCEVMPSLHAEWVD